MSPTLTTPPEDRPRESFTFADGQTVPFCVSMPPMPHPVHLVPHLHARDLIAACVPRVLTSVPSGSRARFLAQVHELDCVHGFPAIVREKLDGPQIIYCPNCRKRRSLDLAAPALAPEAAEREERRRYRTGQPRAANG